MNKKIIFIADFFAEHVLGGGELNNKELIELLEEEQHIEVSKIQSHLVKLDFLKRRINDFFIVSNFVNLDYSCRTFLSKNANYVIYEHDHKYLASRNPATYKFFKAPISEIRNYFFYKNAQKIFCQSDFHKKIIEKNLELDNIVSIGGNLWSEEVLNKLRILGARKKEPKCSIMNSRIPHKNTRKAQRYCDQNGIEYDLISDTDPLKFLEKISKNKTLVFFPATPETLSRIIVEARMMGMSIKTNDLVGASQETWFSLKGDKLIDYMLSKREEILELILQEIEKTPPRKPEQKKISIITTFYEGEQYLEEFLKNITCQTIFNDCELIIVDSGSPGNEKEMVSKYLKKYENIKYYRYPHRFKPTVGLNLAIKESSTKYLTFAFLDDKKNLDCLETLLDELENNKEVDLVYGDCLVTDIIGESPDNTKSNKLFDHSTYEFSKENMVKCLPGPMPMWRKQIHEKNGFFDQENCDFADDWEMWLRAVDNGSKFKKIDKIIGLYQECGRSKQENNLEQRKEEAHLFLKYSHIFGYNYSKYEPYFRQFAS